MRKSYLTSITKTIPIRKTAIGYENKWKIFKKMMRVLSMVMVVAVANMSKIDDTVNMLGIPCVHGLYTSEPDSFFFGH